MSVKTFITISFNCSRNFKNVAARNRYEFCLNRWGLSLFRAMLSRLVAVPEIGWFHLNADEPLRGRNHSSWVDSRITFHDLLASHA